MSPMRWIVLAAVLALGSGEAAAEGAFIDIFAGVANPISDGEYTDNVDASFKAGARVGSRTEFGALEAQVDFTPVSSEDRPFVVDIDVARFRVQFGGRFEKKVTSTASLYVRALGGLDIVDVDGTVEVGPFRGTFEDTDLGLAVEIAGGFMVNLGKVSIGGVIALPMAFHFDEDDPDDNQDIDLEYTGVDLDLMFVLGIPL